MNQENGAEDILQATKKSDWLTELGLSRWFTEYKVGKPLSVKDACVGRLDVAREIVAQLETAQMIVLQAGYKSGKTSLLQIAGDEAMRANAADAKVYYDLMGSSRKTADEVFALIKRKIQTNLEGEEKIGGGKVIILLDEIEAYFKSHPEEEGDFFSELQELLTEGYKIVTAVVGDLRNKNKSEHELPVYAKDRLVEISNSRVMTIELMNRSELEEMIQKNGAIFTKPCLQFIIRESGGHPLLANAIATATFNILIDKKDNKIDPASLMEAIQEKVLEDNIATFVEPLRAVISAGFDPITWQYRGGEQPPDYVQTYRNMLPSAQSKIFRAIYQEFLRIEED